MIAVIQASELQGTYHVPASKSSTQRACAASLLTPGNCTIYNSGMSEDERAAVSIIKQLGAQVTEKNNLLFIKSEGIDSIRDKAESEINCGESGLSLRMFGAIAAISHHEITLTGRGSLMSRPVDFFERYLPELNVKVHSNSELLPIKIKGPLSPKNISVDGSVSSQYITGLLMAFSAAVERETILTVTRLSSKPYVELTLGVMQQFEMNVPETNKLEHFKFSAQRDKTYKKNIEFTVEKDWSSASFMLVGAAIHGDIEVRGLNTFSAQADVAILDALESAQVDMTIDEDDNISIKKSQLKAFEFDAQDCPDLFPPLVALAAHAEGVSRIDGVNRLRHKESNRQKSLEMEFSKLGLNIFTQGNTMFIEGSRSIRGADVQSHNDHRIAMALAIAALNCSGKLHIHNAESVGKSYPEFWDDLKKLNADVTLK